MHLELVELLRCPRRHNASVLVAAANRMRYRFVTDGTLGCPECLAEYAIHDGVASFAVHEELAPRAAPQTPMTDDAPMRLAAQLGLTDGRSVYALVGFDVQTAALLRQIVPARMLLINASGDTSELLELQRVAPLAPVGALSCNEVLPLVPGKIAGVAFADVPAANQLRQWAGVLRAGARVVAPVAAVLPPALLDVMTELVRDDTVWVAQVQATASAPVGISRRPFQH